jgi:hypothetical protein
VIVLEALTALGVLVGILGLTLVAAVTLPIWLPLLVLIALI